MTMGFEWFRASKPVLRTSIWITSLTIIVMWEASSRGIGQQRQGCNQSRTENQKEGDDDDDDDDGDGDDDDDDGLSLLMGVHLSHTI